MSLADAWGGKKPAPVSAQVPERPSSREPERLSTREPERLGTQAPRSAGARKLAKRDDPDFEPTKVYLRSETKKRAGRKWEDAGGGDFSDLVEKLLRKYLEGSDG